MIRPSSFIAKIKTWGTKARPRKIKTKKPVYNICPKILGYGDRDYQIRVFKNSRGKFPLIIKAPTGAGKGLMILYLAAADVIDNEYTYRQVISVPMLNIAKGFLDSQIVIDNNIIDMKIQNFCKNGIESVKSIKEFLLEDAIYTREKGKNKISRPIATVSHQALLLAFFGPNGMTEEERKRAIKHTTFWIDEFHHILGDKHNKNKNQLGRLTTLIEKYDGKIGLASATPFRGDRQRILSEEYIKKFHIEVVSLPEYLETTSITKLRTDYIPYESEEDIFNRIITQVELEKDKPFMVILPSDKQKFFTKAGDKNKFARRLVQKFQEMYGKDRVLDFVTPENQKKDMSRFLHSNPGNFQVIITCVIGREGFNWPPCAIIHNLSHDRSITLGQQKFGRAFRDWENKTEIAMYNYIPHIIDWESEDTREAVSHCFNAVIATAVMDEQLHPFSMPVIRKDKAEKIDSIQKVSFDEIFPEEMVNIDDFIFKEFCKLDDNEKTQETIESIIRVAISGKQKCTEVSDDDIVDHLFMRLLRATNLKNTTLRMPGINVKFLHEMGWDKIIRKFLIGKSLFSGTVSLQDLQKLRKYLKLPRATPDQHFVTWKKICAKQGNQKLALKFLYKHRTKEKYGVLYSWIISERRKFYKFGV